MKKGRSGRFAAALLLAAALVAVGMSPPLRAFESLPDALYLKSGAQTQLEFTLPGRAEIEGADAAVISSFDQSAGSLGSTVTLTAGAEAGEATLTYRGEAIGLTKNEYRILQALMEQKGKVVSRERLMEKLWEGDCYVDENTLSVNVNRLRKKLDAHGLTDFIATKVGMGYRLVTEESEAPRADRPSNRGSANLTEGEGKV